jgi:hypothetical protein
MDDLQLPGLVDKCRVLDDGVSLERALKKTRSYSDADAACRSALPRERFSPLAQHRLGAMADLSPLSALQRTLMNRRRGVARPSSRCHIAHSARLSPRFRKRGRRTRCRAGISDMHIQQLPGRSHTAGRHRHISCDETPEKTLDLRHRKPNTPIDPLRSALCGTPRDICGVMFKKARRARAARR